MIKRTMIATGVALAITTTLTANIALAEEESSFMDELEISGELKNESAVFTKSGQTIGQATSTTDTTTNNSSGDIYKSGIPHASLLMAMWERRVLAFTQS